MQRVAFGRYGSRLYKPRLVDWPVVGQDTEKHGFKAGPCLAGNRDTDHHEQRQDWTMTGARRCRSSAIPLSKNQPAENIQPTSWLCPASPHGMPGKRIRRCSARDPGDAGLAPRRHATTPEAGPRQGPTGNCRVRLACHYHVKKTLNAMLSGGQALAGVVGPDDGLAHHLCKPSGRSPEQAGGRRTAWCIDCSMTAAG